MEFIAIIDQPRPRTSTRPRGRILDRSIHRFTEGHLPGEVKRRLLEVYKNPAAIFLYAVIKDSQHLIAFKPADSADFLNYATR